MKVIAVGIAIKSNIDRSFTNPFRLQFHKMRDEILLFFLFSLIKEKDKTDPLQSKRV